MKRILPSLSTLFFCVVTSAGEIPDPRATSEDVPVLSQVSCVDGLAAGYPCSGIDLLAFLPQSELGAPAPESVKDIWGWTDAETGREYAIVALSNGVAFVDITTPTNPRVLGRLPTRTISSPWRDVKVYRDHAYVVADRADVHGVQVFDLRRLRSVTTPQIFESDTVYYGPGLGVTLGELVTSAHNIAIDEETGFAYVVGSRTTCAGGLHMVDIREPAQPRFAGCFSDDGYTHDTQCVKYTGPDPDYMGREVCFASNEDTLTIVDVEDKRDPVMLSRSAYPNVAFAHQGWLTEDHQYFLLGDELDELRQGIPTRTIIWDVRDLDHPIVIGQYFGPTNATDHNLYIRGELVYEANYKSGLRVLDGREIAAGRLEEIAFFDIVPDGEEGFGGAWSVYPFFPSGNLVVSGMEQGLFVLRLTTGLEQETEQSPRRRGVRR